MKFSELWRISSRVYREVSFQSIFAFRAGAILPQKDSSIERLIKNAELNTLISKILTTIFIVAFSFAVFAPTAFGVKTEIPKELVMVGEVTAFLAALLFLTTIMGLQVTTSLISSKVVDILSPLPMSKREISWIIFICFIRIFDIPLIAALLLFPTIHAFCYGSLASSFASLIAIEVTEIFAVALTIGLAIFFYSKVLRGGGRSRGSMILRFIFLIVWVLPTLGTYVIINFATQIASTIASMTQAFSSAQYMALVYPFSYGFLAAYLAYPSMPSDSLYIISAFASAVYAACALYCLKIIAERIRTLSTEAGKAVSGAEIPIDTNIKTSAPWLGIIRKDLRIASKSPSYASLFLLPVMQTIILVLSFISVSEIGLNVILSMLLGMSMLTLILPPTLLSIEGLASAYTRSLPIRKRTIIKAKAITTIVTYLLSLTTLFITSIFIGKGFYSIIIFGIIHTFSIAAACMLELSIFVGKFWKEEFALGNIYARFSEFIKVIIPGLLTVLAPITVALAAYFTAKNLVLILFSAAAFLEFATMALIIFRNN